MVKFLFGLLLLSQLTWALPEAMSVCNKAISYKANLKVAKDMLTIDLSGIDQAGTPFQGNADYKVLANQDFTVADFQAADLTAIHTIAGIKSFTGGTWISVAVGTDAASFYFFEFEPGLYSVVWIIQGSAIPLGRSNECQ